MNWRIRKVGKEYWAESCNLLYNRGESPEPEDFYWGKIYASKDQNEVADYIEAMINPVIIREYP